MALVNPNIAMSYRPTTEYQPRNALAEYAQIQQIVGGQRQAEIADMQLESLRRERDALGQIQAAITEKGGPPDLEAAADAMIKTGRPEYVNQGMAIRTAVRNQRAAADYFKQLEPTAAAAAAPSVPTPAAGPSVAGALTNFGRTPPKYSRSIFGALPGSSEEILNSNPDAKRLYELYSMNMSLALNSDPDSRDYRGGVELAAEQAKQLNALGIKLPENIDQAREVLGIRQLAAAPVTNVMAAPAAPAAASAAAPTATNALAGPAAAPAVTNALAAPPDALTAQRQEIESLLRRVGNNPELKGEREMLLKRYESVLAGIAPPAEIRAMQMAGFPITQEGYRQYRAAQTAPAQPRAPIAVLQNGRPVYVSPENAVGQTPFSPAAVQVMGMGPQREAPAPTVTQIQDPTDPSRMLTIDARRYQGGGVGSPGVIGTSGKAAPTAAAAVKQEQGLTKADDILTQLQSAYAQLKERKAIPSEKTNVLTNIWASVAASAPGQVAGRTVGTAAQTQRDIIQSSRNQLLLAIKDATGLSSQQLNSNMELQTWLSSLTDPTRSIEANEAILQNVRRFIDTGGKYTAREGSQAAPAAAPAAPALPPGFTRDK